MITDYMCGKCSHRWVTEGSEPCPVCVKLAKLAANAWNGEGVPPVGTECVMTNTLGKLPARHVAIEFINSSGVLVKDVELDKSEFITLKPLSPYSFLPLRTEHDKEVDDLCKVLEASHAKAASASPALYHFRQYAEDLIKAGYRRMGGDS